ncbi:prepilin peptidase [Streptomyces otsuchiensis]|uniref:prepilin peptidase n=1 Tax=Streptomyces otsuchiensis TaxID=2681388 RepID=UPI001030DD84|nr:A24 family peptidase [Streptomyces otsuchiensis]
MSLPLIILAAAFGAGAGALLPRAVFRLAVEPGEPRRPDCAQGHPWPSGPRGWLGAARCKHCAVPRARPTGAAAPADDPGRVHERGPSDPGDPDDTRAADAGSAARPARTDALDAPIPARGDGAGGGPVPGAPRPRRLVPALAAAVCCALLAHGVGERPELLVWLLLVPGMVAVTAVDVAVLRLPDVLTLPMAAVAAVGLGVCALLPASDGSWPRALLGGAVLCGSLFVLALINPRGMGLGDVKLSLAIGIVLGWYGWGVLVVGVFSGFLFAAVFALYLVALRGAGRGTAFSMGPFLAAGALTGVVLGGLAA